jgi:vancomycin permeability regulator SanA
MVKSLLKWILLMWLWMGGLLLLAMALVGKEGVILRSAEGVSVVLRWVFGARVVQQEEVLPVVPWALVPGTAVGGELLKERCAAAAQLFHTGKVKRLLLSGDGRSSRYDEPAAMRRMLLAQGVPDRVLVLDRAGLSTYDSMRAAVELGGTGSQWVVVTQELYALRAVLLGQGFGLDTRVWVAAGVCGEAQALREAKALMRAVLDLVGARRWTQHCKLTREVRVGPVVLARL